MNNTLLQLFDLRPDQDDADAIDAAIRKGMRAGGTNLWVLMFAIVIASVGLNVNSTAVIIGAMLISPLMGPIVGLGYGAAINDPELIRRAFRSLGLFVAISLATSTLYFLASPLSQAQSELLARTTPTLWDVLIAFFGGAAGIVALTRRDISTVVPGVAIATALMPPLCTAGYGIARGEPAFFLGAFYLFSINNVFIALATLLFVKLLKLPQHVHVDNRVRRRHRLLIGVAVLATLLPSAWLAWRLVENEIFATAAHRLVAELEADPRFIVLARNIDPAGRALSLTLGGDAPPADLARRLEGRLADADLEGSRVAVRHIGSGKVDLTVLKRELQDDLHGTAVRLLEESNAGIPPPAKGKGWLQTTSPGSAPQGALVVVVATETPIAEAHQTRLAEWLKAELANGEVMVRFERQPGRAAAE